MPDLTNTLQEYVATANNPEYNNDWGIINGKFPELSQYDPSILEAYVATANNPKYGNDWETINSKFPELGVGKLLGPVSLAPNTGSESMGSTSEDGSSEGTESNTLLDRLEAGNLGVAPKENGLIETEASTESFFKEPLTLSVSEPTPVADRDKQETVQSDHDNKRVGIYNNIKNLVADPAFLEEIITTGDALNAEFNLEGSADGERDDRYTLIRNALLTKFGEELPAADIEKAVDDALLDHAAEYAFNKAVEVKASHQAVYDTDNGVDLQFTLDYNDGVQKSNLTPEELTLHKAWGNYTDYNNSKNPNLVELAKLKSAADIALKEVSGAFGELSFFVNTNGHSISKAIASESGGVEITPGDVMSAEGMTNDEVNDVMEEEGLTQAEAIERVYNSAGEEMYFSDQEGSEKYQQWIGSRWRVVTLNDIAFGSGDAFYAERETKYRTYKGKVDLVMDDTFLNKVQSYRDNRHNLLSRQVVLRKLHLLNIDPASAIDGWVEKTDDLAASALDRLLRASSDVFGVHETTFNPENYTGQKRLEVMEEITATTEILSTEKIEEEVKTNVAYDVTMGVVDFVPAIVQFAAAEYITGGLGTIPAVARLTASLTRSFKVGKEVYSLHKLEALAGGRYGSKSFQAYVAKNAVTTTATGFNKTAAFIQGSFKEEMKMGIVERDHYAFGSGMAFYTTGRGLGALKFTNLESALVTGTKKAVRHGASGVVGMAAGTELNLRVKALMSDRTYSDLIDKNYDHLNLTDRETLTQFLVFAVVGYKDITNLKQGVALGLKSRTKLSKLLNSNLKRVVDIKNTLNTSKRLDAAGREKLITEQEGLSELNQQVKMQMDLINRNVKITTTEGKREHASNAVSKYNEVSKREDNSHTPVKIEYTTLEEGTGMAYKDGVIKIDLAKYNPDKVAHEIGHHIVESKVKSNPELAVRLKMKLTESTNGIELLIHSRNKKGEFLNSKGEVVGTAKEAHSKMGTLTEFIEAKYGTEGKEMKAEEFVMWSIELLGDARYRDALIGGGLLSKLKGTMLDVTGLNPEAVKNMSSYDTALFLSKIARGLKNGTISEKQLKSLDKLLELGHDKESTESAENITSHNNKSEVKSVEVDKLEAVESKDKKIKYKTTVEQGDRFNVHLQGKFLNRGKKAVLTEKEEARLAKLKEFDPSLIPEGNRETAVEDINKRIAQLEGDAVNSENFALEIAKEYDYRGNKDVSPGMGRMYNLTTKMDWVKGMETYKEGVIDNFLTDTKRGLPALVESYVSKVERGLIDPTTQPLGKYIGAQFEVRYIESIQKIIPKEAAVSRSTAEMTETEQHQALEDFTEDGSNYGADIGKNSDAVRQITISEALGTPKTAKLIQSEVTSKDVTAEAYRDFQGGYHKALLKEMGGNEYNRLQWIADRWQNVYNSFPPEATLVKSGETAGEGQSLNINRGLLKLMYTKDSGRLSNIEGDAGNAGHEQMRKVTAKGVEGFMKLLGVRVSLNGTVIPESASRSARPIEAVAKELTRVIEMQETDVALRNGKTSPDVTIQHSLDVLISNFKQGKSEHIKSVEQDILESERRMGYEEAKKLHRTLKTTVEGISNKLERVVSERDVFNAIHSAGSKTPIVDKALEKVVKGFSSEAKSAWVHAFHQTIVTGSSLIENRANVEAQPFANKRKELGIQRMVTGKGVDKRASKHYSDLITEIVPSVNAKERAVMLDILRIDKSKYSVNEVAISELNRLLYKTAQKEGINRKNGYISPEAALSLVPKLRKLKETIKEKEDIEVALLKTLRTKASKLFNKDGQFKSKMAGEKATAIWQILDNMTKHRKASGLGQNGRFEFISSRALHEKLGVEHMGIQSKHMSQVADYVFKVEGGIKTTPELRKLIEAKELGGFARSEMKLMDQLFGPTAEGGMARISGLGVEVMLGSARFDGKRGNSQGKDPVEFILENIPKDYLGDLSKVMANTARLLRTYEQLGLRDLTSVKEAQQRMKNRDAALAESIKPIDGVKKGSVFDFDKTAAESDNVIIATKKGNTRRITAEDWPNVGEHLEREGWKFDFTDFNKVTNGRPGPLMEKLKNKIEKFGVDDVFILTARAPESAGAINKYLQSEGINLPLKNIVGIGNSTGRAKGEWFIGKYAEGYRDMYFVDDALGNVEAVREVFDKYDIKGNVSLTRVKKSVEMDKEVNLMIERVHGIDAKEEFSIGSGKKKGRDWWFGGHNISDFEILSSRLFGKGKDGDGDRKFMEESITKPYLRGRQAMHSANQKIQTDIKHIHKNNKEVVKSLKSTAHKHFTNEQAVRVYLWDKVGTKIPGLTVKDQKRLVEIVAENPALQNYANVMHNVSRFGDKWVNAGNNWHGELLKHDFLEIMQGTLGRQKYLGEALDNMQIIFSERNLNKMEGALGKDWRVHMENRMYQMTTGKRNSGLVPWEKKFLNYFNGAAGVTMFFNRRSAFTQSVSLMNYVENTGVNNPLAIAKQMASPKQFMGDFLKIINSDYLKQRRDGGSIELTMSDVSDMANSSGGSVTEMFKAFIGKTLTLGYTPTKWMDSFAISYGGATHYRSHITKFLKEGHSQSKAEALAWEAFVMKTEPLQQSTDPMFLSSAQTSTLGQAMFTFKGTPTQMFRKWQKSTLELKHGRGKKMEHILNMAYYGPIQAGLFYSIQSAFWTSMFDDDGEVDEKTRDRQKGWIASGIIDGFLQGTGVPGNILVAIKNTAIQAKLEHDKGFKGDGMKVFEKAVGLFPTASIKVRTLEDARKTYSSGISQDLNREMGMNINNPFVMAHAKVVSGTVNLPLDKVVKTFQDAEEIVDQRNTWWQRLGHFVGGNGWNLGTEQENLDALTDEVKESRRVKGKEKAKVTRENNKAESKAEIDKATKGMTKTQKGRYLKKLKLEAKYGELPEGWDSWSITQKRKWVKSLKKVAK